MNRRITLFLASLAITFCSPLGDARAQPAPFLDEDGNDSVAQATVLPPGVLAVAGADGDDFGELFPDTVLGEFDEVGDLVFTDDNNSALGDGFASGLFLFANDDGTVRLKVSGLADFDFDGLDDNTGLPHQETGQIEIVIEGTIPGDPADPDDSGVDFFDFDSGFLEPGEVLDFLFEDDEIAGLGLEVDIDNAVSPETREDFRDFYRFTGLAPGAPFVAETSELFPSVSFGIDTILAQFDESGNILALNDDFNDDDRLSQISGVVPASGEIILAVTGFDDFDFGSPHDELGDYVLSVTIVPEPTTLTLSICSSLVGVMRRR